MSLMYGHGRYWKGAQQGGSVVRRPTLRGDDDVDAKSIFKACHRLLMQRDSFSCSSLKAGTTTNMTLPALA